MERQKDEKTKRQKKQNAKIMLQDENQKSENTQTWNEKKQNAEESQSIKTNQVRKVIKYISAAVSLARNNRF